MEKKIQLWFDEKKDYVTADLCVNAGNLQLWFDEKKDYVTAHPPGHDHLPCCGLMKKKIM